MTFQRPSFTPQVPFSSSSPLSEDVIRYHGENRGRVVSGHFNGCYRSFCYTTPYTSSAYLSPWGWGSEQVDRELEDIIFSVGAIAVVGYDVLALPEVTGRPAALQRRRTPCRLRARIFNSSKKLKTKKQRLRRRLREQGGTLTFLADERRLDSQDSQGKNGENGQKLDLHGGSEDGGGEASAGESKCASGAAFSSHITLFPSLPRPGQGSLAFALPDVCVEG
ncbi:hypothetical protein BDK51DRAFT_50903 [Blyttiomyces helicus]|uniref:Uncharacterized protein n=1 Tax=Blyttiomyces helicus TaxID=388810 RepID=A0A4P9W618_9FUNG|nr:hypothetical protein BDK51DRAFT_50903 [Blyttiomyces helicus]|eukprot:RKO87734.1 hypothetical protein BDK51DRAFT_50903 [Blyttiomyces helicus]